mmetsp:Transcript_30412/g.85294  ORF Transcript_30412/g.85294 Transcript_30412/m.85294 type:complete len:384 (+) Transcript_30412:1419-2570(+)
MGRRVERPGRQRPRRQADRGAGALPRRRLPAVRGQAGRCPCAQGDLRGERAGRQGGAPVGPGAHLRLHASRRPRPQEDLRGPQAGRDQRRERGSPNGDPRQDAEGLQPGHLPGQEHRAPAEEPQAGRDAHLPGRAGHPADGRADREGRRRAGRRVLQESGPGLARGQVHGGEAPRAGRLSADARSGPDLQARRAPDRGQLHDLRQGQPEAGKHHHGVRRAPPTAHEVWRLRQPLRAHDHRRGAHVRPERVLPRVQDPRPVRTTLHPRGPRHPHEVQRGPRRQDLAGGHQRGGRTLHLDRDGHRVRLPGLPDDALLHILLHVRFPARGRPDLAGRRRACQRLPAWSYGWPNDPERRGPSAPGRPLSAHGPDQSRRHRLGPSLRL